MFKDEVTIKAKGISPNIFAVDVGRISLMLMFSRPQRLKPL